MLATSRAGRLQTVRHCGPRLRDCVRLAVRSSKWSAAVGWHCVSPLWRTMEGAVPMGAGIQTGAGRGAGDVAVVVMTGMWRVVCLLLTTRSAVGAAALAGVTTAPEQPQHQPWVQLSQPGWPLSKS